MRHVSRTHKVNISSIKDEIKKPHTHLDYVETNKQCADIFTKGVEPQKWDNAVKLINIISDHALAAGGA